MMRRTTLVTGLAAAIVLLGGSVAYASDYGPIFTTDGDPGGYATWTEDGDKLTVCDVQGDGFGARGYIYRPNPGDAGNGTVLMKVSDTNSELPCASVSVNIPETGLTSIKVCLYQGARVDFCNWHSLPDRF